MIAAVPELMTESGADRRGHVIAHEEPIQFRGDELSGHRLLEDDVNDVLAVERSGLPEEHLLSRVVLIRVELELEDVVRPAGE